MASLKKSINVNLTKSYFYARLSFYQAKRHHNESVFQWGARVVNLALKCGFSTEITTIIRDIFVIGMGSGMVQDRLLEENALKAEVTFTFLMNIATITESSMIDKIYRIKNDGEDLESHKKITGYGQFRFTISPNTSVENYKSSVVCLKSKKYLRNKFL